MTKLLPLLLLLLSARAISPSENKSIGVTAEATSEPTLADLLAFFNVKFDALDAKFDAKFDALDAKVDALDAKVDAKVDALDAKVDAKIDALAADVAELLSASQTPRSATRVSGCAKVSTRLVSFPYSPLCSAFAYNSSRTDAVVFVTAAHCLKGLSAGGTVKLLGVGSAAPLSCTRAAGLRDPALDVAVLDCEGAVPVLGLAPSTRFAGGLSQILAIAGFAEDAFANATDYHVREKKIALNVNFAHTVGVAGPGIDNGTCTSSDEDGRSSAKPLGFLDHRVTPGMSGGPILDMECGVVGIANGRTCGAGTYVSLAPVDAFLSARRT
jgi:hypothetical protein